MSDTQVQILKAVGQMSASTVAMVLIGLMIYLQHTAQIDFNHKIGSHLTEKARAEDRQADAMEQIANRWFEVLTAQGEQITSLETRLSIIEARK